MPDMDISGINVRMAKEIGRQYAKNGAENYARIKSEFQRANYSIDSLPPLTGIPAIILGSGPSLDDCIPYLKDFKGVMFASPSQLDILEKHEITPTYVVAVDAADNVAEEQVRADRDFHGMILLTHPYVSPKLLDMWTGAKRYFHLIADDPHFNDIYPWIKTGFPTAGCVNNTQVVMAYWMGCSPIVLAGVDMGYPEGWKRAQDYRKRGPYRFDPKPQERVLFEEGKVTMTSETLFYANILLGIWKMYKMRLVRVTDRGSCKEIPFIEPKDLGNPIDVDSPTPEQIARVDASMIEQGMFAEILPDGKSRFVFAEAVNQMFKAAQDTLTDLEGEDYRWTKNAAGEWSRS